MIRGEVKIRDGMFLRWKESRENSPTSTMWCISYGLEIEGRYIWRDVLIKLNDKNNPTAKEVEKQVRENTSQWLNIVANFLLEPQSEPPVSH